MDFQPQVLSQSDLNVEVSQSIRGATAWLFLASCHFIYEVLVFDKRISFMQISGFFLPDYQARDPP